MLENVKVIKKVTWIGLISNLALAILKFVCGILGHSQVVIADAVHSLSDLTTDVAILVGVKFWTKPADSCHPHGHHRIETLITTIIGAFLAVVAGGILWNAIANLHDRHETSPGWIAFAAAVISIIAKEILYRWTVSKGEKINSMPLIANAWHHRSDALSSLPAAIAVAVAAIDPAWAFIDHVGAVLVSLFIFAAAYRIVKPSLGKLVDSGASEAEHEEIKKIALGTTGVKSVHAIRTRYIGSSHLAVDLHIQVDKTMSVFDGHEISGKVKNRLLSDGPLVIDVIVHLEPY